MAYDEIPLGRNGKIIVVTNPNSRYHKKKITIVMGEFTETKSEAEYRKERKNKSNQGGKQHGKTELVRKKRLNNDG